MSTPKKTPKKAAKKAVKKAVKKVRKKYLSNHPLESLDPDRFLEAWNRAQRMADAKNIVPLSTKKPVVFDDGTSITLMNHPMIRFLEGVRATFTGSNEAACAMMRFLAIMTLIEHGELGVFFHKELGVYNEAIRALAVARCDAKHGYDLDSVHELLSEIPPPV